MKAFLVGLLSLVFLSSSPALADVTVNGQLIKAQLEKLTSDPTCSEARIFWDSDDDLFRICDGSSWLSIADLSRAQTFTNKTLTSPILVTPTLGVATATSINKVTITAPATSATLTIANGKTATVSNTLTFSGTDSSSVAFGAGGTVVYTSNTLAALSATSSAAFLGVINDETGSGLVVGNNAPSITAPVITGAGTITTATAWVDPSVTTKKAVWDLSGATSAKTITLKSNHTNDRTITFPDATTTVVGTDATQTVTNKTVDDSLTMKQIATPSNPSSGYNKIYAKSDGSFYKLDSSGLESSLGGSSTGSGEPNVVTNPTDAANWAASGAGITVATDTTSSELPLYGVVSSGIKITPSSGTPYVYYRWKMPTAFKNRKLKTEWWQHYLSSYASGDLKLDVYKHSDSGTCTYSGGSYTRFALSTDSSAVTSIPAQDGKFTSTFDADSSDCYELRVVRTAGTSALVITNVVIGPGLQPQGYAGSPLGALTVTVSNNGSKTFTNTAQGWREGDKLRIKFFLSGDASASGSAATTSFLLNMPSGYTINTSALPAGSGSQGSTLGDFQSLGVQTASQYDYPGRLYAASSTTIGFLKVQDANSVFNIGNLNVARAMSFFGEAVIPISEWAGAGTVNVVQNDCEYVYNSSTSTGSDDTTSFAYGYGGALIQNITGELARRVRFQTPISSTSKMTVEVSGDQIVWVPVEGNDLRIGSNRMQKYEKRSTNTYGMGEIQTIASNSTDVNVTFGQYSLANGTNYADAGQSWATFGGSSTYWRVKKCSGGQAIGFGIASAGSSGLINYYQEDDSTLGSVTFAGNLGGSASSGITVKITRIGRIVTLDIPSLTNVVPTTSSTKLISSIALPTWARPTSTKSFITNSYNNGSAVNTTLGYAQVTTAGIIEFYRDGNATAYTNSANAGWNAITFTYSI